MCRICTAHGPGKRWYLEASRYDERLHRSEDRDAFIKDFIVNFNRHSRKANVASVFPVARHIGRGRLEKYSDDDHTGQAVSFDDASAILRTAGRIFLTYCPCRRYLQKKDEMVCMTFSLASQIGEKIPPYAGGRYIEPEKAIDMVAELKQKGYVQSVWTFKSPFIGALCNCRDRECEALRISKGYNFSFMLKGHEEARTDPEKCQGCGKCRDICQFGGIEMRDGKARLTGKCHGCGNCAVVCTGKAITMVEAASEKRAGKNEKEERSRTT